MINDSFSRQPAVTMPSVGSAEHRGASFFPEIWSRNGAVCFFSKQGENGHFYPSRKVLQNRTIFLSNSTQILPKFLPGSTPVEDGRFLNTFLPKFAAALVADATSFFHIYAFNKNFFAFCVRKLTFVRHIVKNKF